jgi:succinate dehydrogenase/fumarate reductase-like Fe-S protein
VSKTLNLTLRVWRQPGPDAPGQFETHRTEVSDDASFLEMLDLVNERLVEDGKDAADSAMDAAACIGCGACVAACPNSAANLFTAAKMQHLNQLPQGQAERWSRSIDMVNTMEEFFGSCTNHGECQEACPKEITIDFIAMMNRDYLKANLVNRRRLGERKVG